MNEKPIIFSGPMVRAILEGRKTQTRRVLKPQPIRVNHMAAPRKQKRGDLFVGPDMLPTSNDRKLVMGLAEGPGTTRCLGSQNYAEEFCSYGKGGDRLWVRETHYLYGYWRKKAGHWHFHQLTKGVMDNNSVYYAVAEDSIESGDIATKRTARGWHKRPSIFMPRWASRTTLEITDIRVERLQEMTLSDCEAEGVFNEGDHQCLLNQFEHGWNALNARRGYSWDSNPWVWVLSFRKVEK